MTPLARRPEATKIAGGGAGADNKRDAFFMRVVLIDEEIVAAEALKAGLIRNGVACDAVDYEMDDLIEATVQGCEAVVITVPHSKIDVVRFIEMLRHRRIGVPVLCCSRSAIPPRRSS